MMKLILVLFIFPCLLFAQERVSPEDIQQQLTEAETQFDHALTLFNPWYTGPLITPGAGMTPPGKATWQPYLYITGNYAAFDQHRHSVHIPTLVSLKGQPLLITIGITPSIDTTITMGAIANWKQGKSGGGLLDSSISLGFLINKQTIHSPQAKFSIAQSFPTGKYKDLNTNGLGLNGTGAGAWQTQFSFAMTKIFFWNTLHPLNSRIAVSYQISTPIWVTQFNSYGGGFGTRGTVHPGNTFTCDMGFELSINQPWAIALDVAYNCTNRTTFHGHEGIDASGNPASTGGGYSDQLSLAPAIEYNFTDSMGIIAGIWFTVYGRNAPNFASGVFNWYWQFP